MIAIKINKKHLNSFYPQKTMKYNYNVCIFLISEMSCFRLATPVYVWEGLF